ncbi:MAG: hypothetical protein ACOC0X_00120 [Halobacteriota archaeon]
MTGDDPLRDALANGEALRYEAPLRRGTTIGLTDDRLLLVDDQRTSIPYENVKEVRLESFDWFLGIMSLALVAFGLASTLRRPIVGLGFAVVGVVSLWFTYRRRNRVILDLHTRARPVTLYPDDPDELLEALEVRIDAFEARRGEA